MSKEISAPVVLGVFHPWTIETKNYFCYDCTSQLSGLAVQTGSSMGTESGGIISFLKNKTLVSQVHIFTLTHTKSWLSCHTEK